LFNNEFECKNGSKGFRLQPLWLTWLVLSAECRRIHTLHVEPDRLTKMIKMGTSQTISIEFGSWKICNVKFSNEMIIL
jgi:hypothetical protein